jgi:hypothetical protein
MKEGLNEGKVIGILIRWTNKEDWKILSEKCGKVFKIRKSQWKEREG